MRILVPVISGILCLLVGLLVGVCFSAKLKSTEPGLAIQSAAAKVPFLKAAGQQDPDSPFEQYDYPIIKWRAHPLSAYPGGIIQLATKYEQGTMKYKLTVFKAPEKPWEVELLDDGGFKLNAFEVQDFHPVPGAPDIMEARDAIKISEDDYKKIRDYSTK